MALAGAPSSTPVLRWLGHAGFAVGFADILFIVDPYLPANLPPDADLILCTHAHQRHMHAPTLKSMLEGSPHAKVVVPKSAAEQARDAGVPFERMTTTDAGLRVEYFKNGQYGRVYAAPSAHPDLDWTPLGGYPYLGYLMRFGPYTVYHAGDSVLYDKLAANLRPYNVTAALLPVGGKNFGISDAAALASEIGAKWVIPMHYEDASGDVDRFINHMLGFHPEQRFKVFERGESWVVPAIA
jgi:L-ascorbate metabolism protein UlaG (beta-lactamase superfamily)